MNRVGGSPDINRVVRRLLSDSLVPEDAVAELPINENHRNEMRMGVEWRREIVLC